MRLYVAQGEITMLCITRIFIFYNKQSYVHSDLSFENKSLYCLIGFGKLEITIGTVRTPMYIT